MSDIAKDAMYAAFEAVAKGLVGREDRFVAFIFVVLGGFMVVIGNQVPTSTIVQVPFYEFRPHNLLIGFGSIVMVIGFPYIVLSEFISWIFRTFIFRAKVVKEKPDTGASD